jgi:hypothetical protein
MKVPGRMARGRGRFARATMNDCTAPRGRRHFTNDPKHGTNGVYRTVCGRRIEAHDWVAFHADVNVAEFVSEAWNVCGACLSKSAATTNAPSV